VTTQRQASGLPCSSCILVSRAMAQAVSTRSLIAEARVHAKVSPYGINDGQSDTATGTSPSSSVLPFQCFTVAIHTLIPKKQSKAKQICPATRHGGAWGERRYSSYSFLTSALDGGEWSASRPGHTLPRGKDPLYPLCRRLDGPQSRPGHRC
jgi:hypothetical protein